MTRRSAAVRMALASVFGLAAVEAAMAQPAPIAQLAVTSVVPDPSGETLTIDGVNFGPRPFVTLELVPLTVGAAIDTQIVVVAPIRVMPRGQYLLTVSRGPAPEETGSFHLQIGTADPQPTSGPREASGSGPAIDASATERAAQVGDRVITVAEVDREWRRTDPASYVELSRRLHEMRRRVAERMMEDELLAREAAARGVTTDALLKTELPKRTMTLPDSAVTSLYQGLGDRAGGASLDQMRPSIREWLARKSEPELARMNYIEELKKVSTRADLLLIAPRVAVEHTAQDVPLGSEQASVELVAFGDFQSSAYAQLAQAFGRVRDTFGDRIRFVFKHLPTLGPESIIAAEAASCANAQGKFWAYHDALLAQKGAGSTRLQQAATTAGLDRVALKECLDGGGFRDVIRDAIDEAERYGLEASPSFLINGRLAPQPPPFLPPFDFLKRIVEEELSFQARGAAPPRP
ncbi:MAG: thioredoxin domain-containing protein [Vicinamibacterales bacterium]